jgi:PAS domain S-box-containing protein
MATDGSGGQTGQPEDVAALRRVVESLRASEERFRQLAENAREVFWLLDVPGGRISYVNPAYEVMWGRTCQSLYDAPEDWYEALHPEDRERVVRAYEAAQAAAPYDEEYRIVHLDGSIRWVRDRAVPVRDAAGRVVRVAGIAEDITARKQSEEDRDRLTAQLVQADRLVAMGTMAAGVAHEINNPLAYVLSSLDHLEGLLAAAPAGLPAAATREALDVLREAREGAERVRVIVKDLKAISRAEESRVERTDLRSVLDAALNIARNELKHRARVVKAYGPVPVVRADAGKLGQVFLNLLVNAAQAIPAGHVDEHQVRISTSTDPQGNARIEVHDTGAGVPVDLADRIFEPFVTSKRMGEGTGLGLSICKSVVASLGGEISCQSTPGAGSTFCVTLPAAGPPEPPAASPAPLPPPPMPVPVPAPEAPRGRVAVVDDEPAVRRALLRALSAAHEVESFESARALADRLAAGATYDVILCDLMMPEMTGMELHQVLQASAPAQAAALVFMTGGAFTSEARAFLDAVPNDRIEKPFDVSALRALIRGRVPASR